MDGSSRQVGHMCLAESRGGQMDFAVGSGRDGSEGGRTHERTDKLAMQIAETYEVVVSQSD